MDYVITHYFVSFEAAVNYYKPFGYDEVQVRGKLAKGEVVIGKPVSWAGRPIDCCFPNAEGRYVISVNTSAYIPLKTFTENTKVNY